MLQDNQQMGKNKTWNKKQNPPSSGTASLATYGSNGSDSSFGKNFRHDPNELVVVNVKKLIDDILHLDETRYYYSLFAALWPLFQPVPIGF